MTKRTIEKIEPTVGIDCTLYVGSDSYSAKVILVSSDKRTIWVSDQVGETAEYTLRKDGNYRERGIPLGSGYGYLRIGTAKTYRDRSF